MQRANFSVEQQIQLCQLVAKLVRAKLPLTEELLKLSQTTTGNSSTASSTLREALQRGESLEQSLTGGDSRDAQILAACIRAGQKANALPEILEAWAQMHIANTSTSKSLRNAMIYPLLLILVTCISIGFVFWNLIPEYQETFQLFRQTPPFWFEWIVWLRSQFWSLLGVMLALLLLPLLVGWLRNRKSDARGIPRGAVRRLRQQSLATSCTAWMLAAKLPLNFVSEHFAKIMGLSDAESSATFSHICSNQIVPDLPSESQLMLAALHSDLVTPDDAAEHMRELARHLKHQADRTAVRRVRWLPMMVALAVGTIVISTYAMMIYLPWIYLLRSIVEPGSSDL